MCSKGRIIIPSRRLKLGGTSQSFYRECKVKDKKKKTVEFSFKGAVLCGCLPPPHPPLSPPNGFQQKSLENAWHLLACLVIKIPWWHSVLNTIVEEDSHQGMRERNGEQWTLSSSSVTLPFP